MHSEGMDGHRTRHRHRQQRRRRDPDPHPDPETAATALAPAPDVPASGNTVASTRRVSAAAGTFLDDFTLHDSILAPRDVPGGQNPCARYVCGPEAACQPLGATFRCICPRDLSEVAPGQPCRYAPPTVNSPPTVALPTPAGNQVTRGAGDASAQNPDAWPPPEAAPEQALRCPRPEQLCGMEAACQLDRTGAHRCICPHDLSKPSGNSPDTYHCNRNIVKGGTLPSPYNLENNTHHISGGSAVPGWVLITIPVLLGVVLLIIIVFLLKRRCRSRKSGSDEEPYNLEEHKMELPINRLSEGIVLDERMQSNPNYYHESPTASPLTAMCVTQILKEQICNMSEIGQGQFGKVYKGVYLPVEGEPVDVAVKLLKETANVELQEDFIREVEIMASCRHTNIVNLLGVLVQENGVTPWMVFEYMAYGDLAELLRSHAPQWGSPHQSDLPLETLHSFASQVASGMQYLASQHFVHRDLACRNILVGENMAVKISDFGMSRDIYTCDYYKVAGGSRMLPVRWMAPESISYGKFTLESDIWSYGVVLWEIYAYGKQPYYGHSNKEVVTLILRHILLIPPETCPSPVCAIMEACWRSDPARRIDFSRVVQRLDGMRDTFSKHRYENQESSVPYTELQHDLNQLARIEAEVLALGLADGDDDSRHSPPASPASPPLELGIFQECSVRRLSLDRDLYLQPDPAHHHDYIQPIA